MPEEQRQIKLLTALGNLLTLGPDRQCAVDVTKAAAQAAAGQCRTQDEGRRRGAKGEERVRRQDTEEDINVQRVVSPHCLLRAQLGADNKRGLIVYTEQMRHC